MDASNAIFSTAIDDLPAGQPTSTIDARDGDRIDLRIAPITKTIGVATVRMLSYGGSVPGPTLRVAQDTELFVDVVNDGDLDATVHWHGLRLDNRYDGTSETQQPLPIGGAFGYLLSFPDPGVYWYHPHIREDYGQEMGLYGAILVEPFEPDYWPPAHREMTLTLDDVLIEDGVIAPFRRDEITHSAMGRFGNVMLVNGESDLMLTAKAGEVVRFYLINTANTRVFKVGIPGAGLKLVGGDSGRYEREELVESVILAPSERAVVDVYFDGPGELTLEHRTPNRRYPLATIRVSAERAHPPLSTEFAQLRESAEMIAERVKLSRYLDAAPDKTLGLVAEMNLEMPEIPDGSSLVYFCPMHPHVTSHEPGKCPECRMKLLARADAGGHGDAEHAHGHGHETGPTDIEWEDDMVEVNRNTTPSNTRWKLIDRATGAEGSAIDWRFRVGDRVKLRLVNEMDSDHPMHHPFHVHGAGRFLILARDGVPERNLVWKDTVLVRTGETVDILLDVTNPGRWMAHCHIAEHHESGMMLSFDVDA